MILDELFSFPIVITDRKNEEAKDLYGSKDMEIDIVIADAEFPYYSLVGISDKWMPDEKSFHRALEDSKFNACLVTIANVGTFLCPWNKEKFKKHYREFVAALKPPPQITEKVEWVKLSKEDLQKLLDNYDELNKEDGEDGK